MKFPSLFPRRMAVTAAFGATLTLSGTLSADPLLSPQEALKKMEVPPGFQVDLLAAEPDLVQPIAFCWDARGRIWVVEGNTYPTRATKPPKPREDTDGDLSKPSAEQLKDIFSGKDRILIFEDADGDGSFETRKVFAENLNLVSGIEMGFGGVYIGAAPYLLHIPVDEKTDKPAGDPVIIADGFGYQDTHETLNSFIWGPDGWLYGCHGVFTHSEVRVCKEGGVGVPPAGAPSPNAPSTNAPKNPAIKRTRTPLNCHYWRYHPTKHAFEAYASGTSNSWGFDYNENGDWFAEACVIPHFWHIIQGGNYLRQSNPLGHFNPYVYTNIETIADHLHYVGTTPHSGNGVSDSAGGGHAHCGLLIYNGDNFPAEYRGRAMMFNIHGQRINQEILVPEGSGYVAKHGPDFLKTNDKNFTGVSLKVGPDGAVYFIDWYDQQKCHRPQPEVWDRSNGRLYRVKYASTWKPWKGDLRKAEIPDIAQMACAPDSWRTRFSRRALQQLPTADKAKAVQGVYNSAQANSAQTTSIETSKAISTLFTAACVGLTGGGHLSDGTFETRYVRHGKNQTVRAAGVREYFEWVKFNVGGAWQQYLIEMAKSDPSPQVRLAIASGMQKIALDELTIHQRWELAEALVQHEEDANDHNLPQMYWYAIEPCVPTNPEKALELAAKSKIPLVAQNIARRVADMGNDAGLASLLKAISQEKTGAGLMYLAKAALDGLRGRTGVTAPAAWQSAYANFDEVISRRPDAKDRAGELRDLRTALAVAFGDQRVFPQLREQLKDTKQPVERRQTALQTLVAGKDPELTPLLIQLLDDPALRLAALKALPLAPK